MSNEILLSICIPTYKRESIVRDMLKSIYSQGVNHTIFEVCITDNSDTDETKKMLEAEFTGIDNLKYKKVTCKGFLNSIEALKFGQGKFLKLHNDYSYFKPGALQKMISVIKKYEMQQSEIFFSMGELKKKERLKEYIHFNDFMHDIHYFSTWSTSFSIWKSDLEKLLSAEVEINYMYPHTSLLYKLTDKTSYIVDDYNYVTNAQPKKKGGYNLIDNFVRIYLTMVRKDLLYPGYITTCTYKKIEKNILRFTAYWYYTVMHNPEMYTFTFENHKKLIKDNCGKFSIVMINFCYCFYALKAMIKKTVQTGKG